MPARSKFDEASEDILRNIRAGLPPDVACELAGIARSTFYEWLKKGRQAKSGKVKAWAAAVETAKATAESMLVAKIAEAALAGDTKAAMWLLERSKPERWARPGVAARPSAPPRPPEDLADEDDDDWDLDNVTPLYGSG